MIVGTVAWTLNKDFHLELEGATNPNTGCR